MGGSTPVLAKPTDPGYGYYTQESTKRRFTACTCTIQWMPLFEKMMLLKGFVKQSVDIIQIVGGAEASANTHLHGGTIDIEQVGPDIVALARAAGANASWSRYPPAFTNDHTHMVLTGCPHNADTSRYQTVAQRAGYDGLGYMGKAGKDPYPPHIPYRTFGEGMAWMKAQILLMSTLDAQDISNIAKAVWDYGLKNRNTGVTYKAGTYVEGGAIWAQEASINSKKSLALDTAQTAALEALKNNPNITPESLQALVEQAVHNVVGEGLSGSLTVDFGGTPPAPTP